MLAVRAGTLTADEASTAIASITGSTTTAGHVPTKPAPQSMTALMIAARQGDANALAALNNYIIR